MKIDPDKRFINFPIFMLSETYTDPQEGMRNILYLALVEYSRHCRRDYISALAQAIYTTKRQPEVALPSRVVRILRRKDVADFADFAITECWVGHGTGFVDTVSAEIRRGEDFTLSAEEKETLVDWLALRDAASYFGRRVLKYGEILASAGDSQNRIAQHANLFGTLAPASIPASFFFETLSNFKDEEAIRLFRCVCAVRSMIGQKRFVGTTKDMLRARMIGAKTHAIAEAMAAQSEPLRAELEALGSRKRFDRILTEGAVRKFYGKFGTGRRIYLSLTAKDPDTLATMVGKKSNRHDNYKTSEQKAREKFKGHQGCSNRGIKGDIKGGSFNKTLK